MDRKKYDFKFYMMLFIFGGVIGRLWEDFVASFYLPKDSTLITHFPLAEPYGMFLALLGFLAIKYKPSEMLEKKKFFGIFVLFYVLLFIFELVVGLFTTYVLGFRLWDYSHYLVHIDGQVCLYITLQFTVFSLFIYYNVIEYINKFIIVTRERYDRLYTSLCFYYFICLLIAGIEILVGNQFTMNLF